MIIEGGLAFTPVRSVRFASAGEGGPPSCKNHFLLDVDQWRQLRPRRALTWCVWDSTASANLVSSPNCTINTWFLSFLAKAELSFEERRVVLHEIMQKHDVCHTVLLMLDARLYGRLGLSKWGLM